jgi:hypothetical protein
MPIHFPIDPIAVPKTPVEFRTQLSSILQSYHALDLDLLHEIIQNSVDAVEDKFSTGGQEVKPRIELELDEDSGTLTIRDNGPGVPDSMLEKLGCPANTDKIGKRRRGHKGVGLVFAAWSSLVFRFATRRNGESKMISGKLRGGIEWITNKTSTHPKIEEDSSFKPNSLKDDTGTVFEFKLGEDHDLIRLLKRLNQKGIETLLRQHTAVGYSDLPKTCYDDYPEWVKSCKVKFKRSGQPAFRILMGYHFPHEYFKDKSFDIRNWASLAPAAQETLEGKKKCIFYVMKNDEIKQLFSGTDEKDILKIVDEQKVSAYGAFLDSKPSFEQWNNSLFMEGTGAGRKRKIAKAGIHFSTVTMPTGEILDVDLPYGAGNKDRLYILVQFNEVIPDYGRKTFQSTIVEIGQRISRYLTEKYFVPYRKLLVPSKVPHGESESEQVMSLEESKADSQNRMSLGIAGIGIVKIPSSEQDVVALFHALLGAGYLKGYEIFSVYGSTAKYDCWFEYNLKKTNDVLFPNDPLGLPDESFGKKGIVRFPLSVLEFKPLLSELVDDFESDFKSFEEILVAVAWDKGEDVAFAGSSDYSLESVDSSSKEKQFHGETHRLGTTALSKKIHVILLKDVISSLVRKISGV